MRDTAFTPLRFKRTAYLARHSYFDPLTAKSVGCWCGGDLGLGHLVRLRQAVNQVVSIVSSN
jgi:hypothetical protein